jgi:hypothetical protein
VYKGPREARHIRAKLYRLHKLQQLTDEWEIWPHAPPVIVTL